MPPFRLVPQRTYAVKNAEDHQPRNIANIPAEPIAMANVELGCSIDARASIAESCLPLAEAFDATTVAENA
jgi:hypothetical protein